MADDESCLVEFEEVPDLSHDPRLNIPCVPLKDESVASGGNFSLLPESSEISREQETSVPDLITAVFVVQFDTRRGLVLCLFTFTFYMFGHMMLGV